ncbi:MAG: hypothetical protein U9O49_03435 [Candidatus Thermoplasmatota archaeon]|nr:hypothetical protein [Candidatus Thermoplasmatota archaeon]
MPNRNTRRKIRFNRHPFSERSKIDFHLKVVEEIDEVLKKQESERRLNNIPGQNNSSNLEQIVEAREPYGKRPETPNFYIEDNLKMISPESISLGFETNLRNELTNSNEDFANRMKEHPSEPINVANAKIKIGKKTDRKENKTGSGHSQHKQRISRSNKKIQKAEKQNEIKTNKWKEQKQEKIKRLELEQKAKKALKKERELARKLRIKEKEKNAEGKKALKEEKLRMKSELKKLKKDKKKRRDKKEISSKPRAGKKQATEENPVLDEDIIEFLRIADELLEKLPGEVINEFAQSKDFELYEKVMNKYKVK